MKWTDARLSALRDRLHAAYGTVSQPTIAAEARVSVDWLKSFSCGRRGLTVQSIRGRSSSREPMENYERLAHYLGKI